MTNPALTPSESRPCFEIRANSIDDIKDAAAQASFINHQIREHELIGVEVIVTSEQLKSQAMKILLGLFPRTYWKLQSPIPGNFFTEIPRRAIDRERIQRTAMPLSPSLNVPTIPQPVQSCEIEKKKPGRPRRVVAPPELAPAA